MTVLDSNRISSRQHFACYAGAAIRVEEETGRDALDYLAQHYANQAREAFRSRGSFVVHPLKQ